jgi:hypothetical protein
VKALSDGARRLEGRGMDGSGDIGAAQPRPLGCISETISGRAVDLLTPDWRDVDVDDMAHSMGQIRRWCGQSKFPIRLGGHSLLVASLAPPKLRLPALLHDGHEYVFDDLSSPSLTTIAFLAGPKVRWAVREIKHKLDVAVARAVIEACSPPAPISAEGAAHEAECLALDMMSADVKRADAEALAIEDGLRTRAWDDADGAEEKRARYWLGCGSTDALVALVWLTHVRAACAERFAGAGR